MSGALQDAELRERRARDAEFRGFWSGLNVGDHCLYKLYDGEDRLLYVGITTQLRERIRHHHRETEWCRTVERIEVDWNLTKLGAMRRERAIILRDDPVHNRTAYAPPSYLGAF